MAKHVFLIFEAEWKSEVEQLQILASSECHSFLFSCIIKFNSNSDFFLVLLVYPTPHPWLLPIYLLDIILIVGIADCKASSSNLPSGQFRDKNLPLVGNFFFNWNNYIFSYYENKLSFIRIETNIKVSGVLTTHLLLLLTVGMYIHPVVYWLKVRW